jgi:hypothetical protein
MEISSPKFVGKLSVTHPTPLYTFSHVGWILFEITEVEIFHTQRIKFLLLQILAPISIWMVPVAIAPEVCSQGSISARPRRQFNIQKLRSALQASPIRRSGEWPDDVNAMAGMFAEVITTVLDQSVPSSLLADRVWIGLTGNVAMLSDWPGG